MKNIIKSMAVLSLVAAAGCAETRGTRVDVNTETGEAKVTENSYRLAERVKVARVTYGDNGDGIRNATVTIESQTKRRLRMQVRIVWMDAEGAEIDADGKSYKTCVIDGNDTAVVTGMAPNANGVRAKVQIREVETAE